MNALEDLLGCACEAQDTFGLDELERFADESRMKLHDLNVGDRFRFPVSSTLWECRGNGWYSSPIINGELSRQDGGPWHCHNVTVIKEL